MAINFAKPAGDDHGLALDVIQIDGGTQSRATLNQHVVDDYAEAIKAGATFPPIVVFYDGKKHWLADGFHRFHAYQKVGRSKVAADVRQGTRRDAILHSVGANEAHGLRRTNDDKRRAVMTLLGDAEWGAKPERWVATTANVSHTFVQKVRAAHLATLPDRPAEREVERGGSTYTMKVAKPANVRQNRTVETGGDAPKELTSETVAPQGVEGGDEPEKPVEELTPARNIFDELVALWKEAAPGIRQDFKAYIRGDDFVAKSRSASEADSRGGAPSPQAHTPTATAPNSQFQAKASEDNGAGGANSVDGVRMTGEASRVGAGRTVPATSEGKDVTAGETALNSNSSTSSSRKTNKPEAAVPPPSAASGPILKPNCLNPDGCKLHFTSALCSSCNDAEMKARAKTRAA